MRHLSCVHKHWRIRRPTDSRTSSLGLHGDLGGAFDGCPILISLHLLTRHAASSLRGEFHGWRHNLGAIPRTWLGDHARSHSHGRGHRRRDQWTSSQRRPKWLDSGLGRFDICWYGGWYRRCHRSAPGRACGRTCRCACGRTCGSTCWGTCRHVAGRVGREEWPV